MNRCLICHRKLKDQESINRKIGPTCFARIQKVTKEEKARKKARKEANKRNADILKNQISIFEEDEQIANK